MTRMALHPNVSAFLDMIAVSEGTAGRGDDGYNILVGGALIPSYKKHPRTLVWIRRINNYSSAAGRYQFVWRTWEGVARSLKLPDFSPESQDKAAIELLRRRDALDYVIHGRFERAVELCQKEWASLPGAGYGQHENALAALADAYKRAGGAIIVGRA